MVLDTVAALSPSNRTYFVLNGKGVNSYSPSFSQSPGGEYAIPIKYGEDAIYFGNPDTQHYANTTITINGVPIYGKGFKKLCFVMSYSKGAGGTGSASVQPFIDIETWDGDYWRKFDFTISETGLNRKVIYKIDISELEKIIPAGNSMVYKHRINISSYASKFDTDNDCLKLYAIYAE